MNPARRFLLFAHALCLVVAVLNPLHSVAQTKGTPSTTKILRAPSARTLIQEAVNATNRGFYLIDFSALIALDNPTFVDYSTGEYKSGSPEWQRQRLQAAHFIKMSSKDMAVPNLTGRFGNSASPGLLVQLSMDPSNPRLISGTFEKPGLGASCAGRLRGSWIVAPWAKGGTGISLFFDVNPGSGCLRSEEPVQYEIRRVGETRVSLLHRHGGSVYVQGPWAGEGNLPQYTYSFHDTFNELVQSPGKLQAGRIEVDSVEQLFLSPMGETAAECNFRWRVEFNAAARILAGNKSTQSDRGKALFRKQPDGEWMLAAYELN